MGGACNITDGGKIMTTPHLKKICINQLANHCYKLTNHKGQNSHDFLYLEKIAKSHDGISLILV